MGQIFKESYAAAVGLDDFCLHYTKEPDVWASGALEGRRFLPQGLFCVLTLCHKFNKHLLSGARDALQPTLLLPASCPHTFLISLEGSERPERIPH